MKEEVEERKVDNECQKTGIYFSFSTYEQYTLAIRPLRSISDDNPLQPKDHTLANNKTYPLDNLTKQKIRFAAFFFLEQ